MKNMKLIPLLAFFGMMAACHTNYLNYEEPKDMIYITGTISEETNTRYLSFQAWEYTNPTKEDGLGFKVVGFPANVDREINFELIDSLTTAIEGQDYKFVDKIIMPKGEVYTYSSVIIWNQRKEDDTRSDSLRVGIRIVENEYFDIKGFGGTDIQFIYVRTEPQQPIWWQVYVGWGEYGGAFIYFGDWSPGLMAKMLEQYQSLETTHPEVYNSIHKVVGDHFDIYEWPSELERLICIYIAAPLYYYYLENPEPGVNIPKPKYER